MTNPDEIADVIDEFSPNFDPHGIVTVDNMAREIVRLRAENLSLRRDLSAFRRQRNLEDAPASEADQ